jgi:hypothetical protein
MVAGIVLDVGNDIDSNFLNCLVEFFFVGIAALQTSDKVREVIIVTHAELSS